MTGAKRFIDMKRRYGVSRIFFVPTFTLKALAAPDAQIDRILRLPRGAR